MALAGEIRPLGAALLEEADEREVAERRHGAALDQANAVRPFRPLGVAFERELGAPAELARRRRKQVLESAPRTGFGTDAADQDDLTARLQNPRELIERRLRIGRGGHDILRDHDIERVVWKREALGVHDPEALDVAEPELGHAFLRLAQHLFGDIDAAKLAIL